MKVYGLVILLCLSLLFIKYAEAQVAPSSDQNNFKNDPMFGGTVKQTVPSNQTLANPTNQTLSKPTNQTLTKPANKTVSKLTATSNKTVSKPANKTVSKPANKTVSKPTVSTPKTLTIQERQLLEKQFTRNGTDYYNQGNYTAAIMYYDKALLLNSTDIIPLYNKALALENLGRINDAMTFYNKVLAINPNDTDTLSNVGFMLEDQGEPAKAITYYDKVLAINPTDTSALYYKGVALEKLGNKTSAALYYKKVLDVNPSDAAALSKLNLTYNNANKTETAKIVNTDQTALIVVLGVFVIILTSIIIINIVAKRTNRTSTSNIFTEGEHDSVSQTPFTKESEDTEDGKWRGV